VATITSAGSGAWGTGATWVGGSAPSDGDDVIIVAGHNVQMDVDQSGWTGLQGVVIQGGTTPGMLYWANGSSGHLKIRTGYHITGTTAGDPEARGRILANSDGSWSTATELAYATKAVIDLQGTAQLQVEHLDVKMICDAPTNTYVECYGEDYGPADQSTDVNTTTGVIDWGETPPAANTAVRVRSSGTLPGGMTNDDIYYVYAVDGDTCKLVRQSNNAATLVIPNSIGTGNLTMYTGWVTTDATSWGAGKDTPKVIQDVTADNWTAADSAVLCNEGPQNYDQQRITLSAINSGTIQLSAAVDSNQYPLAKIILSSRNCSVRSAGTSSSQAIVLHDSADTHGGTYGEIRNSGGSGTTFYGYGIHYGEAATIAAISGCTYGSRDGSGHTATTISGCTYGIGYGSGHTATTISGCSNGIRYGSGHTATTISGCSYGIGYGSGHTATTISGCSHGIYFGSHVLLGTIFADNTYDLRLAGPLIGYGCSLRGSTQNYEYLLNYKDDVAQIFYDPLNASDEVQKGRILAWTCGGYCTSEEASVPASPPISLDWCHKFTFETASHPVWADVRGIRLLSGVETTIPVYVKCTQSPSGMTEQPRVQLIDPLKPWNAAASLLDDEEIADTTDWQTVNLVYTADYDKEVWVRVRGTNADGTLYWWVDPQIHSAGSGGGFVQCSSGRFGVQES